jgi:hypothetical protein
MNLLKMKTDEPHVHEVKSSILPEVRSLVVQGLFSPWCLA